MGLAITLWVLAGIILAVSIVLYLRNIIGDCKYIGLSVLAGILAIWGVFYWCAPAFIPVGTIYDIDVDNSPICFADYQEDGNDLIIPTHYYVKRGFTNMWEFCDTPIRVEVSEGQSIVINDHRPIPQPHVSQPHIVGGCQ